MADSTTEERVWRSLSEAGLDMLERGQADYEARVASYWSLTPRLKPWMFVQPRDATEVSRVVKALVGIPDVQFAVRSGGHTCAAGANNIQDGVTIDLGLLAKTTYNPDTGLASVRPGARWADVYAAVQEHGVMVAGGREGLVGVGGLLTGGGKTFYTCRYGFACDQVVNYEVVLADGSIVEANETTNVDLFRVLKGGSNNFGIVTRFDMITFPAKPIWDGIVIWPVKARENVLNALVGFTQRLNEQPDSHILLGWQYQPQMAADVFLMGHLTHLDGVENAASLTPFVQIPGQGDLKITTVAEKVAAFLLPSDKHDQWFSLTYKLDIRILRRQAEVFEALVEKFKVLFDGKFHMNMVLQPLPASFIRHSVARGGNMFGLERCQEDSVLMVIALETYTDEQSATGFPILKAGVEEVEAYAQSVDGNVEFRYLNYCNGSQDPLGSYGAENIKKMKDAAIKYDPDGVFQTRVPGGYKISKVKLQG